ncbi:porin family protein [Flavobacterium sp.]|uniref:porin family protein n=1 Tax=Flavobacterium sp. TaxID=239 RepID=UPI00344C597E
MATIRNTIKTILVNGILLLSFTSTFAQELETQKEQAPVKIDSLYREDQFYLGLTYNTLQDSPAGVSQQKIALGLAAGFLRDMPINKNRNLAIATGIGFALNNYNQNLTISQSGADINYSINNNGAGFSKNKFTQLLVEVPLEFRWRTSTFESYKFWRIYGGVKFSYLLYDRSVFTASTKSVVINNKDFNEFLYGVYLSGGYNTINLYAYYGLNPLFKSAIVDGQTVNFKSLQLGIIFYIL